MLYLPCSDISLGNPWFLCRSCMNLEKNWVYDFHSRFSASVALGNGFLLVPSGISHFVNNAGISFPVTSLTSSLNPFLSFMYRYSMLNQGSNLLSFSLVDVGSDVDVIFWGFLCSSSCSFFFEAFWGMPQNVEACLKMLRHMPQNLRHASKGLKKGAKVRGPLLIGGSWPFPGGYLGVLFGENPS